MVRKNDVSDRTCERGSWNPRLGCVRSVTLDVAEFYQSRPVVLVDSPTPGKDRYSKPIPVEEEADTEISGLSLETSALVRRTETYR